MVAIAPESKGQPKTHRSKPDSWELGGVSPGDETEGWGGEKVGQSYPQCNRAVSQHAPRAVGHSSARADASPALPAAPRRTWARPRTCPVDAEAQLLLRGSDILAQGGLRGAEQAAVGLARPLVIVQHHHGEGVLRGRERSATEAAGQKSWPRSAAGLRASRGAQIGGTGEKGEGGTWAAIAPACGML